MVIFYVVFCVGYLVFVSLVWIALVVDLGLCWLCLFSAYGTCDDCLVFYSVCDWVVILLVRIMLVVLYGYLVT